MPEYQLMQHQKDAVKFLDSVDGIGALLFDPGVGKGHPLDEPVLTPNGWTEVGSLAVGDQVIGSDGQPTEVVGVYDRGDLPVYRVTFNDGASVRVDGDHLWQIHYRVGKEYTRVVDTHDLIQSDRVGRYYIPRVRVSGNHADLPVDPYLLGALLADGCLKDSVVLTKNEESVVQEVAAAAARQGCGFAERTVEGHSRRFTLAGLIGTVRALGVAVPSAQKFIPEMYFHASVEQRLALIAGLFDCDGSVRRERGTARYGTTSPALAEGVRALLWSLGIASSITESGDLADRGYLFVQVRDGFNPFRAASWRDEVTGPVRTQRRSFKSIEPIGVEPVRCIKVAAEDSLYVTKDYIVTHNTGSTMSYIDQVLAPKYREVRVLVVAPLTATDTWVLQAPPFMDSPVKARVMSGSTATILGKIREARDWTKVPTEKISVDHPGTTQRQVSGNRVTILSVSAGAVSKWCSNRTKTVQMLQAVRKYDPHLIVVDESQIIKSTTANISKAMYQLGQTAQHRIILTGTVTPLGPLDVYGQWRFLAPWTFSNQRNEAFVQSPLTMTKSEAAKIRPWPWYLFRDRYTIPGGYQGKGIGGYRNLDELNDWVAERSMVVRKEDALELPPVTDVDIHVSLNTKEWKAYKQMADDLVAQMEDGSLLEAPNALAKMMKLRQIAAGFVKDTDSGVVHVVGDSLRKAVKEVVETQLAGENRLVVFAYFRKECELLADSLRKSGVTVEVVTGSTSAKERLAIRKRFADVSGNPGRTILVAQQRTMSLSVNELVVAQHAIYASMSERRDDWVQSRGRLDRNGQKGQAVTFWNCYSPGLIGNVMLDRHKDKGDLETALLNHIKDVAGMR